MDRRGKIYFINPAKSPILEIKESSGGIYQTPFEKIGQVSGEGANTWLAEPLLPQNRFAEWQFRIKLDKEVYDQPQNMDFYYTTLSTLWLQEGQIFSYPPAPRVSPAQVIKIPEFKGSMPTRPLYVYLPRGYVEHQERYYPVLFMHDGQNCFEAFGQDSFAGSWQADQTADQLIGQGRMQECIIVGVGHGERRRNVEYLPPYVTHTPPAPRLLARAKKKGLLIKSTPMVGKADQLAAYYRYEVAPYIQQHYRALSGREHTATCGSSMGGLFSTYLAWERTEFARHHAALSPSYWITKNRHGLLEMVERLRTGSPRDIRLWLDSGTRDAPDYGDDGRFDTVAARDALLENGYQEGANFRYYLADGAIHSEAAWAARLPLIFQFLFPIKEEEIGKW
jgi:predicted alpha/beta superfamily hydrolase